MFNNSEVPSNVDALQLYINAAQENTGLLETSPHQLYLTMITNPGFVKSYKRINDGSPIINTLTPRLGYGDVMKPNLFVVFGQDSNKDYQIQLLVRQERYGSQEGVMVGTTEIFKAPLSMEEMAQEEIPMFRKLFDESWQKTTELMNGGPKEWLKRTLPVTAGLMEKYPDVTESVLGGIAEGLINFQGKLDKRPQGLFFNNNRLKKVTTTLQTATLQMLRSIK